MQARTLKIIAALLIVSAIVMGVIGYKISQQDAQRPVAGATPPSGEATNYAYAQKVLIATENLNEGTVLKAEQVQLLPFPQEVADSFSEVSAVVGKRLETSLRQGDLIRTDHFVKRSLLAADIAPGHRAMAVEVDEVVGSGGFIQPGDYVDVIFATRANKESYDKSVSRRILRNIRVLAFGADITSSNTIDGDDKAKANDKDRGKRSRSAVLQVPMDDINRLMLAENTGRIRLAVLGEEEMVLAKSGEATTEDDLIDDPQLMRGVTGLKPPPVPKSVYVYSGDKVETIRVPK